MGRKGGWFSAVKKVFVSDSKKGQKHHHRQSKLGCFGVNYYEDLDMSPEGKPISVVPSLPPRKDTNPTSEAENEQSKQAFSLVFATAVAAGAAAAAAAAAEISCLTNTPRSNRKANQELAAIKIQIAYRGYMARRSLRGLRGLARLRKLVQGQSVQRQAATTLQCMQTLSRLQSQIRARKIKMSEENQALQRQMQQKREKEFDKSQNVGEKWDDSSKSKEQVEAKLLNRQVATMRRERALAYASTHQQTWRNSTKSATNATFMDPNNPHWGWNWLERWMATRPWEGQNTTYHIGHASAKSATGNTMSIGEITKLYSLRDQNNDVKNSPTGQKPTRPRSSHNSPPKTATRPPSSNGIKPKLSKSSKGGSWGGSGDSKNMFTKSSENNRRHSIGASPVRDNESNSSSSPALSSHRTPSTKVASKAKPSSSKVRSTSFGVQKNGTTEKASSAPLKKRLSFPASPAGTRKYSVSTRPGNVASNKSVANATIPEEKVRVRNGGGR